MGDQKQKGKICKTCDNKFMMYNTYKGYQDGMEQQDDFIEVLCQQLTEIQEEAIKKDE